MKNKIIDFLKNRSTFIVVFFIMIVLIKLYHIFIISIDERYYCISYLSFLMAWESLFNFQLNNIFIIITIYVLLFSFVWVYILSLLYKIKIWYIAWIMMILYIILFLLNVIDTNKLGL